ncbi:MAG: tyrosine-type recombinase/integrase [Chloroflexi bacterium]|nr:tyrosine-type recombinase/integrase [Chloroflexota bacterium]
MAEETGDLAWPNPVRFKRHAGKLPRRLPRDLSDEQVERLWAVIREPRDRAWFALLLRAGRRVGEVISLKLADLLAPPADRPARLRVCGKGRQERVVLFTADAWAVLQAWLAVRPTSDRPEVFLNERGRRLTTSGLEWLLHGYGEQAGVSVTPHQLRHTFARQATEAGMPVTSLGKLLGHAQVSTTQIYTAGADPELAQAYQTAMSRLENAPLPHPTSPAPPVTTPLVPDSPPSPPLSAPVVPDPDWRNWAPHLPSALRQACLDFVQRRLPTWKPTRRRQQALHVLGELRRFFEWQLASRPIQHPSELGLADLQAFQSARAAEHKASNTINVPLGYLLTLLHEQADQGQPVDARVFRLRALPKPDSLPRHLNEAEAQTLEAFVRVRLDSPDPRVRLENACFFVLAHTGLRASECTDLGFQDWDASHGRLVVRQGKGQRDRVVYLSDTARRALQQYLGPTVPSPTAPLFRLPKGQALSYMWLYEHITALGQAAGVSGVTPHRLRHTLATRLLNAGMDITRIQKLLGHEHLDTTMIYARVLDTTVEADYRQAMAHIERVQMPLSDASFSVANWPGQTQPQVVKVPEPLDNPV